MISYNKELDFENIINKISFPRSLEDYRATYNYDADVLDIEKFESEIKKSLSQKNYNEILDVILVNKKIFNPDVYLFHIGKLVEKDYNDAKEAEILKKDFLPRVYSINNTLKPAKSSVEYIENVFSSDLDVVDISINTNNKELVIESSQELYGDKDLLIQRGIKNREKLLQIQKEIDLKFIVSLLNNKDIITFCRYTNLGDFFSKTLFENSISNEYKFLEIIMKYAEYLDLDKMLVLANFNFYNKYGTEFEKFSEEELLKLNNFTNSVEKLLDNAFIVFNNCYTNEIIDFQTIKISINTLNNCFIGGKFYTVSNLNEMAQEIALGKITVDTLSKDTFKKVFNFTNSEIKKAILNNADLIEYLLKNDYLTFDEIEELYTFENNISNDNLIKLLDLGILNSEKILDYYLADKINIENIKFLKDNINEIDKIVSNQKFIELYLDKDNRDDFNKYAELYKLVCIDGKTIDERNKIGRELVENNIDLLDDENIKELYYMDFIPVDSLIDFSDNLMIIDYFFNGCIKPKDIKRLYKENKISKETINEIIKSKDISITKKLVFIYSSFPNEEDKDFRDELLNTLPNKEELVYIPQNDMVRQFQEEKMAKQNNNSSILCKRWNVLSNFDENYSQKLFDDGHIEFYIPNIDLYIVEKLYDSNNKTAYGAATYAIKKDIYEENKDFIVKNNKVNRSNLVKLHKNKEAFKLIHLDDWGSQMNDFLNTLKNNNLNNKDCI